MGGVPCRAPAGGLPLPTLALVPMLRGWSFMSENVGSYPAISTSTNVCEEFAYSVFDYELPGFGVQHSDRCNQPNFIEYCPDCHHTDLHSYHCNRWDCPVCYPWTANKRARESADRLYGVMRAWQATGADIGFFNHVVMSPPASAYEDFDEKKAAKDVRKYCKEIGLSGGALIFHPYRIDEEIEMIFHDLRVSGELKVNNWIAVHQNILKGSFISGREIRSWRDYVYFSPHWHIVGFFKLKERSNVFYERTGWTYKNVSWEKYHEALDKAGARRTIAYLCTHHRYQKGKQSLTYFGKAAPNQVSRTTTIDFKVSKCPVCSVDIKQMDLDGNVVADLSRGDLYRLPVHSAKDAEHLIDNIKLGRFQFDPKNYNKCWYPVVHRFYTVRTDFSRHVKPVEVVTVERDTMLEPCLRPWATEEEIQARKEYESSLPPIDWEKVNKHRVG